MTQHHRETTATTPLRILSALLTFASALAVTLVVPEAHGQGYSPYPAQQTYYQQQQTYYQQQQQQAYYQQQQAYYQQQQAYYQQQQRRASSRRFRFAGLPVVGRTTGGGGWSFGAVSGAGYNLEGVLSFRLESEATYRRGHVIVVPEAGYSMFTHNGSLTASGEATTGSEWSGELAFQFGLAGLRLGWGDSRIGDVYALSRVLIGGLDSFSTGRPEEANRQRHGASFAFGLQHGVGAELWYGIISLEVSHVWMYSGEIGNVHGVRFTASVDATRLTAVIFYLFAAGMSGGLPRDHIFLR